MHYFLTLVWMYLKRLLRSPYVVICSLMLIADMTALASLLPQAQSSDVRVGVLADGVQAQKISSLLRENSDYAFIAYDDRETVERGVAAGKLHCGYLLSEGEKPITALVSDGSYLRPLLDEIVISCYFEVHAPAMAESFLREYGFDASNAAQDYAALKERAAPMQINVKTYGGQDVAALEQAGIQPLLYAVLISLFLLFAVIEAILPKPGATKVQKHLSIESGYPVLTAAAPVAARTLLYLAVLFTGDILFNRFVSVQTYSFTARCALFLLLGLISSLLALVAAPLRRAAGFFMALSPPLAVISVVFSGAVLNPANLPMLPGALRFLSPAWYGLQLLGWF